MKKICKKCNIEKELDGFHKAKDGRLGVKTICKACYLGHEPYKPPTKEKACLKCGNIKFLKDFPFIDKEKGYRHSNCRKCQNKIRTISRNAQPEKEFLRKRKYDLKKKYDLTPEDYSQMFENQQGKCQICNLSFNKLSVDHNHLTSKVRGLLCNKCNVILGLAKDNVEILQAGVLYLEKYKE